MQGIPGEGDTRWFRGKIHDAFKSIMNIHYGLARPRERASILRSNTLAGRHTPELSFVLAHLNWGTFHLSPCFIILKCTLLRHPAERATFADWRETKTTEGH